MLKVEKCVLKRIGEASQLAFGITDGKKWFAYAYSSKERAEEVLGKAVWSASVVRVNIAHPKPLLMGR